MPTKPKHKVRCTHTQCKHHIWYTTSQYKQVTCPNCGLKTLNTPYKPIPLTSEAELHQKATQQK